MDMKLFKKLALPPLLPLLVLILLAAWTLYSETAGEVRMINGRPDNAPRRAAAIIMITSPVFYLFFTVLNFVDWAFDRLRGKLPWTGTSALILGFGTLCTYASLGAELDTRRHLESIAFGFGLSTAMLLPMALIRRHVLGKDRAPQVRPTFSDSKAWNATKPGNLH